MFTPAAQRVAADLGLTMGRANLEAFADTLLELAKDDRDVLAVTSDSRGSGKLGPFAAALPNQIVEVGIAEQNLVGMAAGLASAGKNVFAVSPACFLTARALEQIKNDVAYSDVPVSVVGISAGVSYGALGSTHHSLHDIAALRAIHNIDIVVPADNFETRAAVHAASDSNRPVYLRFGKAALYDLPRGGYEFEIGRARVIRDGRDVAFIATGETVIHALFAAASLERQGLSCRVVSMHTVKPLDAQAVLRCAAECRAVVTAEEHSVAGGLGEACASLLMQSGARVPFRAVGIPDEYTVTGSQADIFRHYGLSMEGLSTAALELLRAEHSNACDPDGATATEGPRSRTAPFDSEIPRRQASSG
jgi:transketolase